MEKFIVAILNLNRLLGYVDYKLNLYVEVHHEGNAIDENVKSYIIGVSPEIAPAIILDQVGLALAQPIIESKGYAFSAFKALRE